MRIRRATIEPPFGALKARTGATHFKIRTLDKVRTEMSLHVLAYNLKRVMTILAVQPLKQVNKGPFLFDAIDELHELLQRIEERQHKKTPQLRRLKNW